MASEILALERKDVHAQFRDSLKFAESGGV
jgi:hypothetical protein